VLEQNGPWVGKYQLRVDDLEDIAHTVIGAQSATFALSLPRFGAFSCKYAIAPHSSSPLFEQGIPVLNTGQR
jgi:hypothetical protein